MYHFLLPLSTPLLSLNQNLTNINIRYNQTSDYVQVYDGTQWVDWKKAGILWDGYIYNRGVMDGGYTYANITKVGASCVGTFTVGASSITQAVFSSGNRNIVFSKGFDATGWDKLNVKLADNTIWQLDISNINRVIYPMILYYESYGNRGVYVSACSDIAGTVLSENLRSFASNLDIREVYFSMNE